MAWLEELPIQGTVSNSRYAPQTSKKLLEYLRQNRRELSKKITSTVKSGMAQNVRTR